MFNISVNVVVCEAKVAFFLKKKKRKGKTTFKSRKIL